MCLSSFVFPLKFIHGTRAIYTNDSTQFECTKEYMNMILIIMIIDGEWYHNLDTREQYFGFFGYGGWMIITIECVQLT